LLSRSAAFGSSRFTGLNAARSGGIAPDEPVPAAKPAPAAPRARPAKAAPKAEAEPAAVAGVPQEGRAGAPPPPAQGRSCAGPPRGGGAAPAGPARAPRGGPARPPSGPPSAGPGCGPRPPIARRASADVALSTPVPRRDAVRLHRLAAALVPRLADHHRHL